VRAEGRRDREDEVGTPLRKEEDAPPPEHALLALQRQAGNQATARMIQRVLQPAKVKPNARAGLHKFKVRGHGIDKVRTGGAFGSGIKQRIPAGTLIHVDPQKGSPTHMWAETAANQGYIKKAYVDQATQIGTSDKYAVQTSPTLFQIYDMTARALLGPEMPMAVKAEIVGSFQHALAAAATAGLDLEGQKGMLESLNKSVQLGVIPQPALWQLAAGNVAVAQGRVATDRAELISSGLITAQHNLTGIRFTGADFHKGGQAPFFLTFTAPNDVRRVVYKPGNLQVDKLIFGRGNTGALGAAEPSLAEALNPANDAISQYVIIAKADYGFMQFVGSDGPQGAADVSGIYKSLAANMAVSYLVGLEDVHHENVLMLKDRVQVIDMEATTGQFTQQGTGGMLDPADQGKGFRAQLWNKALYEGIRMKLLEAIAAKSLTTLPVTAGLDAQLIATFRAVLETSATGGFDAQFDRTKTALAGSKARVVPIATATFYQLITKAQGKSQGQWDTLVDTNPTTVGSVVQDAKGQTSNSVAFLRALLKSPGTLASLLRGEVPYYYRHLDDDTQIFDEQDNAIAAAGFVKVSGEIDEQMQDRRDALQAQGFGGGGPVGTRDTSDAVRIFVAQMVPLFTNMNDELNQRLTALG
jgi:hypothetical protein